MQGRVSLRLSIKAQMKAYYCALEAIEIQTRKSVCSLEKGRELDQLTQPSRSIFRAQKIHWLSLIKISRFDCQISMFILKRCTS